MKYTLSIMTKTIHLFVFTFLLVLLFAEGKRIRCHNKGFEKCFNHFFSIGKRPDATQLATTAEGLNLFCADFNKTMDCVHGQLKRCGTPLHRELWDLMTGDMQHDFRAGICFDNEFRREYLKHGKCIRDHVMGVDDAIPCLNNYLLAFEHLATDQPHDFVATICCAHTRKEKCTDQLALKYCGEEAEKVFRVFFDKIHFGFFSTFCYNDMFAIDSEACKTEFPNAGTKPKTPKKGRSAIAKMLYKNFPFNYIPQSKRNKRNQLNQ